VWVVPAFFVWGGGFVTVNTVIAERYSHTPLLCVGAATTDRLATAAVPHFPTSNTEGRAQPTEPPKSCFW